jgi:hypothetical protein
MRVSVHSLHWDNYNQEIVEAQQKVFQKFDIPVNYTKATVRHGMWMDYICRNIDADVFVFFDADCVILNREIFDNSIQYALENISFVGAAQASNHIFPYSHIFAAPCFHVMSRSCYNELGQPTYLETQRSDVAEEVSYIAEEKGKRYKAIYPNRFDGVPEQGVYRLGNYGYYGTGTLFQDSVYHLFESRFAKNVDLFKRRCDEIVNDKFNFDEMFNSLDEFKDKKRIVK